MAHRVGDAVTEYRLVASEYRQALARDDRGMSIRHVNHKHGAVFTITDADEAARLLGAGAVVPANADEVAAAEVDGASAESAPVQVAAPAEAPAESAPVSKPARNATRSEWVAYALTLPDVDEELIRQASKADLLELFA